MAKEYLDKTGLTYLWDKLKSYITKADAKIPFGKVDSTSTSTAFTATVDGITELADGVCVYLSNGVVTSASGFTLNINGLGAKPVYQTLALASRSTTIFNINYTMLFVYNSTRVSGGCWDVFYGYDSNTNTIGYQLRTNSMSLPVSGATYRYRLVFTSADGTKFVPANTSTSTNATSARAVNQTPIDPFGEICYYGYTSAVSSGSRIGATYLWRQYAITLGYSFNVNGNETLTAWKPVYLKCTPQSDGSAIIDASTPIVQELPSTADGKIYIYLGVAYSTTNIELVSEHPVYYYKDGAIRLWTNSVDVPTKTSDLTNDSGFITGYTETDPIFTASPAHGITASDISNWNGKSDFSGSYNDLTNKPTIPTVPTNVSAFTNDAGYLTSYTETDPTVPSWAKASTKPSYTASEVGAVPTTRTVNGKALSADISLDASDVGALPSNTSIPTKTSDLTNDSGFLTSAPVASVNGQTGAVVLALGDTNVIETVKVNGTALTPDANKAVDVTVPSYTAGTGIDITNGVISLDYSYTNNEFGGQTLTIG